MRHTLREFIWILASLILLTFYPWWQAVLISALAAQGLLRLTERGLKRRITMLFIVLTIYFVAYHATHKEISSAISGLFRLPHFSLLSLLSAGSFAVLFAFAAECSLWIKYSFRRVSNRFQAK